MYNADPNILNKFRNPIQTTANNADPRPLVYITRNRTAITSQRYWERQQITDTVGTRSSIAVRRPEGSLLADMIFTAQVEDGDAVIRYAAPKSRLNDMEWEHLITIPDVSELSILFDGVMKKVDDKVEAYTTGELPWVFYVDADGSLKYINLDGPEEGTISDNAVNVASVRGLYSESADLNDGIWVFYTNAAGELWEARVLDGEVDELTQITMLPTGVTGWDDVWAGLTFDYRIVLQLKGNDGKVYILLSKSRPSGFNNHEYLEVSKIKVSGQWGKEPPSLLSISTVPESGNYGKIIRLFYSDKVYHISSAEKTRLCLVDAYGKEIYPDNVTQGVNDREVYLHFEDINNLIFPAHLKCLGAIKMGSDLVSFGNFTTEVFLQNLWPIPGDFEHLTFSNVDARGEMGVAFDGKIYHNEEQYLELLSISVDGESRKIEFIKAYYNETKYLGLSDIAISGQRYNLDGVPV